MQRLTRWLDNLIPTHLLDERARWRARFLVHGVALGMVIAGSSAVIYAFGGWWPGVAAMLALTSLLPLVVVMLRATGSTFGASHLGLGLMLVTFVTPTLLERELDGALLCLFSLFPYIAVLLLDGRSSWLWLGIVVVTLTGVVVSHELVLLPTVATASPRFVMLMRVGLLVSGVFLFGQAFARERERGVAEFERLSRAKAVFLANVSHEIRTPMNGVLGLTEAMLLEELPPSLRERLGLVQRSGQSLVALINDLLDLSKVEAGKVRIERARFDLQVLLSDLTRLYQPLAAQKGLEFSTQVDAVPEQVTGDSLRLRQVLSNLLGNALKFTERGTVSLVVTRGDVPAGVRFEVRDTGIGIAADALPRLFTPFEQADASTTRRFGGTGLGLSLSRDLVELMGGTLDVETAPGVGSVFTFELALPVAPSSSASLAPVTSAAPRPSPTAAPVLIVDDNAINLKVASALVERAGYRVVTATNGLDALDHVLRGPLTAVLMDCHMPVMDGFEATERIRDLSGPAASLPIVALTASTLPEELEACRRSGMNHCLTKPVSFTALAHMLAQLVQEPS
ncbi:MAG: ATP-binding protein [Myxococcales bacterium]|nr:ATP-binding protein [Myxococcales bacterium]